jgi:hypothetical protein
MMLTVLSVILACGLLPYPSCLPVRRPSALALPLRGGRLWLV